MTSVHRTGRNPDHRTGRNPDILAGQDQPTERLPALGQPAGYPDPIGDPDFADEHCRTTVADDILTGADRSRQR
ncbi:hypothetical protein ACWDV4_00605 [Micromonospora sp. NPDC003197]